MLWILYAIGAHFLWAVANVLDKVIIDGKVKNPFVYNIWVNWAKFSLVLLIPFVGLPFPGLEIFLLFVFCSILFLAGSLLFLKTVTLEEITRINVWWIFIPIFSLIIEFLVVGRQFSQHELIAFVILVSGAVIASIHRGKRTFYMSRGIWYMLLATFLFAIYYVLFRHLLTFMSFVHVFMWITLLGGVAAHLVLLSKKTRLDFVIDTKKATNKLFVLVFIAALIGILGIFFNFWALSLASAALVFSFEGSQVLFVFIITALLTIFAPHILKEELDRKNVLLKLIAIVLMIVGALTLASGG